MKITHIDLYRYSIPMEPFRIATGTSYAAENVLIYVHTDEGVTGVGECSPFAAVTGETQDTCLAVGKVFAEIWLNKDPLGIDERLAELDSFIYGNSTIKSAFDMALYDIAAKVAGMPLYQYLGGTYKEPVSDLTVGIGPKEEMLEKAVDFVKNKQATTLKIKLGREAQEEIYLMEEIRSLVGPDIGLRVDANQGWDFESSVLAMTGMQDFNIEFCEQPMPKYLDFKMPSLRRISKIQVMADESVFNVHDVDRIMRILAFNSVNIKFCKSGGIRNAMHIHDRCKKFDLPNMIGGMVESRLGLTAKVHFALAAPNVKYFDLDTCMLGHTLDPVVGGAVYQGMKLIPPSDPGIGADVDPDFLKTCERISIQ